MVGKDIRILVLVGLVIIPLFEYSFGGSAVAQTQVVVFSDDFESYPTSPVAVMNESNPPDAIQYSPPHYNPTHSPLPEYWVPASSATCVKRGGCTCWGNEGKDGGINCQMGPNTVFAVTTEQAPSGEKQSMKLGASDWSADKTSLGVNLDPSVFPSGELVSFTFSVWLSSGVDNSPSSSGRPNNSLMINIKETQIRYTGDDSRAGVGAWIILTPSGVIQVGNYHLTTETWHTITVTQDWTNQVYKALIIDGQQPLNIDGQPAVPKSTLPYDNFQIFIDPFADYQSITSAASHGFQPYYAYLDDVVITVGTQIVPTFSTTSTQVTTTSSTTSIPEFAFTTESTLIVVFSSVLLLLTIYYSRSKRRTKVEDGK